MDRRLTAIVVTDVVGYSKMIRDDEEGTLEALKSLRADLIEPKITDHHGRIVKLMGDGMLAEFASVVNAVHAAVQTQQAVAEYNSSLPTDKRIEFRVGIHLGDIVIDGEDIQGDGVNVAARLETLAEPGGICVSGMVYEGVRDRIDIQFEDMGKQEVKNIERPIQVWRWSEGASAGSTVTKSDPRPRPDKLVGPPHVPHPSLAGRVSTFISDEELIIPSGFPDHWGDFPTHWKDEYAQVYVRFLPERSLDLTTLDLLKACDESLRTIPPFSTMTGDFGPNKYGFAACGIRALPDDAVISRDIIQYFRTGEVWTIFGKFLLNDVNFVAFIVEDIFAWTALQTSHFLEVVGFSGSGRMVFGLTGIQDRRFATPLTSEINSPRFLQDEFLFEQSIAICNRGEMGRAAEAAAIRLWSEAGMERPSELSLPQGRSSVDHRAGYWRLLFDDE